MKPLYTMTDLSERTAKALKDACYCKKRLLGMCVPCAMASRILAGEKVSEVFSEYDGVSGANMND